MDKFRPNQYDDYFSMQNLDKLSDVEAHLEFAERLLKKYSSQMTDDEGPLSKDDWRSLKDQLDVIRKKQNDKKLNLSVIGEFSTGKSTFINALLRKDLLASSALQGTTVASTVIDYSRQHMIHLQYLDGRPDEKHTYDDISSMKAGLEKFTTDSLIARQLRAVNVFLPAEVLKDNFRIIDTPGTNVTEAWHEDVTIRTLKEMSDLSIVLISAEKPVPDTMLRFVRSHLEAILPQCVYAVTKLDTIRKKERAGLLDYVKMRLEKELELKEAVVLPYVSTVVLPDEQTEADDELLGMSMESEKQIVRHMAEQKALAQTKKLTSLIDTVYKSISARMKQISDVYNKKLSLLEKTKKTDLSHFVEQEKQVRLKDFDDAAKGLYNDADNEIHITADNACKNILNTFETKQTIDNMKDYISGTLSKDCSSYAMAIVKETEEYYKPVQKLFKDEMGKFEKSFKKLYTSLNIIPLDMSQPQYNLPQKVEIETANISSAASFIVSKLSSENRAFFGGAAAGAAIGSMILPGVGTLVGGFLGLMAGAVAAPDSNKVRADCKDKLKPQLTSYYNNVCDKSIAAVDKYIGQIRLCLSKEIDEYLKRYRDEVDRQIAYENGQRDIITAKINDIQSDMSLIQNRKKQLDSVTKELSRLGRKGK